MSEQLFRRTNLHKVKAAKCFSSRTVTKWHQWPPFILKSRDGDLKQKKSSFFFSCRCPQCIAPTHYLLGIDSFFLGVCRKIEWKHFLSSKISLRCPFISPVLMAGNYADKVSAAKAASKTTCWSSHENSGKTDSTLDLSSTSLGRGAKLGVKVGLDCENVAKAEWLILAESDMWR